MSFSASDLQLAPVVESILESASAGGRAVVLIDGRSGSGKSTLARRLSAAWPEAQLVRLDDLYPGWDGLERGSAQVAEMVLATVDAGWRAWDWSTNSPGAWHPLSSALPLIIEGSGALSRRNRALATYGIWVELDQVTRKARALERDGDAYLPHWDRWAAQEEAFLARENPVAFADLVVAERA